MDQNIHYGGNIMKAIIRSQDGVYYNSDIFETFEILPYGSIKESYNSVLTSKCKYGIHATTKDDSVVLGVFPNEQAAMNELSFIINCCVKGGIYFVVGKKQ